MPKDKVMEEIKKTLKELAESQKKTDKEIATLGKELNKLGKEVNKLGKEVDKVNKMVGDLTDGWGKFVEGLVEPAVVELANKLGLKVNRVYRRVQTRKDNRQIEVDIIIEGRKDKRGILLVVEAKSHFEPDDMQDFLSWFLDFFEFFDIYRDYEVMGVVASPRFGDGVDKYAQKEGLWVLLPSENTMKISNPEGFKPKILKIQ
jgi:uncharacterized protein YoxC